MKPNIKLDNLRFFKDSLLELNLKILYIDKLYAAPMSMPAERKKLAGIVRQTNQILSRIQKRIEILEEHGQPEEDSTDKSDSL